MNNRYAPPQHPGQPAPKRVRLFSPLVIAIHTALVPWLGATLAAINFRRLKNTSGALSTLFAYVLPSVIMQIVTAASYSRALMIAFRLLGVGLAVLLYRDQRHAVGAKLASGEAAPARWYLLWLGVILVFSMLLLIWLFLAPASRHS